MKHGKRSLNSYRTRQTRPGNARVRKKWLWVLLCAGAASLLFVGYNRGIVERALRNSTPKTGFDAEKPPQGLSQLLSLPPSGASEIDIALLNLLCAEGLPGATNLEVGQCLATLDQWATHLRAETDRNLHRYRENPAEDDSSESYFRMLMMAAVVYEDFGVRYNPARMSLPGKEPADDGFFADSQDLFLHGLCGNGRVGTCSSMPVLYAALGRRLGYPLKLVTTKAHMFLRWDSPTERFDLEATGEGMNRYDDDHFRNWPYPVTKEDEQRDGLLKSLTPAEELALFLSLRGHCLREAGRLKEAASCYAEAAQRAPGMRAFAVLLADAQARAVPPAAL